MKIKKIFERDLSQNIETHVMLRGLLPEIDKAINIISKKIKLGGKLLFCGNGGSAADAQHLAAEYLIRLRPKVNRRPLPAMSLVQDTSTLTACGNDYDFSDIFLRPFQALASKNDVLIGITTSGNSLNVLKVLKYAHAKKITTLGFLGGSGGKCKKFCDIKIMVPSKSTARIQECHIFLAHFILERAEDLLISKTK
jgi:D-sedoheptulose 7-phosphate isomerase